MKPNRQLIARFADLPSHQQRDAAHALGLWRQEDAMASGTQFLTMIVIRARNGGKLAELWDEIQRQHNDGRFTENPYRGDKAQ